MQQRTRSSAKGHDPLSPPCESEPASSRAAAERDWRAQTALNEHEIAELVENLDAAAATANTTLEAHASERAALEEALQIARAAQGIAKAELQSAEDAQAEPEKQLIEERAVTRTLQEIQAALIERIPPVDDGTQPPF